MNNKTLLHTVLVAVVLLFAGKIFMDWFCWFGYTESAILYLAAVVGAGFYWLGINLKNK